jgi:hypothetical protein
VATIPDMEYREKILPRNLNAIYKFFAGDEELLDVGVVFENPLQVQNCCGHGENERCVAELNRVLSGLKRIRRMLFTKLLRTGCMVFLCGI